MRNIENLMVLKDIDGQFPLDPDYKDTLGIEIIKFRLKYRNAIRNTILEIVSEAMAKDPACSIIKTNSLKLPECDQAKFVEVVETELLSLHDGNFARYWISLSQFTRWKEVWKK